MKCISSFLVYQLKPAINEFFKIFRHPGSFITRATNWWFYHGETDG
jgi:hypothetical protein